MQPDFTKIHSWKDFSNHLESLTKKQKGDAFELITKLLFSVQSEYTTKYQEVWLLDELPQKVREHLGLHEQDLGIDLIAKADDEYHAIQCKYHSDPERSITFKEVSTFLSLVESNPKIALGYIASNARMTSANLQKVSSDRISNILSDIWESLGQEFFDNARKKLEGKKVKLDPFKPREHQKKALREAVNYFDKEDHSRGKLIFPCGAGKSLTGFWMTQKLKSKATLIAVPSLSLVKQTLEVYLREIVANKKRVKWLCICSDEGIGKNDDVVFYTENLGVPCQTDPEYIEDWLKNNANQELVIFTTYQSGRIIADISQKLDFTFDVGIFDEAHKTVGSDKKLFSHLLFDENISIGKRIFMTATERFYTGSKDDIISMDDESIYGDTFTQMSFKEAIESGLLTDYKVITIDVKKSEIADFIKENNLVQLNDKWKKETEARSLASMLALRKAMKQFPIKNAVSFHSSIEKAVRNKELQTYITDTYQYKPIDTFTVSGKQPTTKRNAIVKEFADSKKALITNARCLTEGVDVPNIDCIVFADPRKSKVDIVQALGRALRKKEGKEWGYVILPVVYDEKTHEIDNDNFQEILAIVRGLASNDERIVEYFKDKSQKEGKLSHGGSQFSFELFSDYIDESELSDQLQIKLWEKLSRFSWMPFEEAREYVQNLNLTTTENWRDYHKKRIAGRLNIPLEPHSTYKNDGWISYGDWLGTGRIANQNRQFWPFEKARNFVQSLGLKSTQEWNQYRKSSDFPEYLPTNPNTVYKGQGWLSFSDWLGTKPGFTGEYRKFEKARDFVHKLGLSGLKEWKHYCKSGKKPFDIPYYPDQSYQKDGWKGYGDWLGTGNISNQKRVYLEYDEAKEFVAKLRLKSSKEWFEYSKSENKPANIPANPNTVYKNKGWKGFGDWLGTGRVSNQKREYLPFEEAKKSVRRLNLKTLKEWQAYAKTQKRPKNIPADPARVYKDKGWEGYGDWLGNGYEEVKFLSFKDARNYVRKLGLKNQNDWKQFKSEGKRPQFIPSQPHIVYKDEGWKGFGDWLGTGNVSNANKEFLPFEDARKFVHSLNLKSSTEWREYKKSGRKPKNIPASPNLVYKDKGWKGFGDWLGTGNKPTRKIQYRSFQEARKFARSLNLKSEKEWKEYWKKNQKPDDIPYSPQKTYKNDGYSGFGDWLGTGNVATRNVEYMSFDEAKLYFEEEGINSRKEWEELCKSGKAPSNIPKTLHYVYRDQWNGWADFLGKEK